MARRFANLDPAHRPHTPRAIFRWAILDPLRGRRKVAPPGRPAPSVEPDLEAIHDPSTRPRITWIGHSSFLVGLGGRSVLVDPVFSRRIAVVCPRYGLPGLTPRDLPEISAVLISHSHYDHMDRASLAALPKQVPAIVPRRMANWFKRWNRRPVTELEWWQSTQVDGLEVTLVPARHWSRRGIFDTNRTHWGGFVIGQGTDFVYHSGDSASFDGFAEIGRKFPGLLAALLPIGGYEPAWFMEKQHMNPEQAIAAFRVLEAEIMVPMHWGTFQLTDEPISEPIEWLTESWKNKASTLSGRKLWVPAAGETLFLDESI